MKTYLFAWNPNNRPWPDYEKVAQSTKDGNIEREPWSCGNNRQIQAGDKAFLIHLGAEPRGLIGSGIVTSDEYEGKHWDKVKAKEGKTAFYADIEWDTILNFKKERVFAGGNLTEEPLSDVHWEKEISGINIPDHVAPVLEERWRAFLKEIRQKGAHRFRRIDTMGTFDWNFDDAHKYCRVLSFEYPEAFTHVDRDKEKREWIRAIASQQFPLNIPDVEWWALRIYVKKSGTSQFDVEKVSKIIMDAFCIKQIKADGSNFPMVGLYAQDTIDYVGAIQVAGERVSEGDSTKVEIFGRLREVAHSTAK